MPIAKFQMADGRIGRFEVPEGTTPEQAQKMISESLSSSESEKSAEPAKTEEERAGLTSLTGLKNLAGAAFEPMASIASGGISAPVSGWAGIAGGFLPGSPGQAADWARKTQQAFTYEPKTEGGKTALEAIGYIPQKIGEAGYKSGEVVSDITGSPVLGAITATIPAAIATRFGIRRTPDAVLNMKQELVKETQPYGYVVTPTSIGESKIGAIGESISNKAKITAKNSQINARARANDIRKEIGLDEGTEIRPIELESIRENAVKSTEAIVGNTPTLIVDNQFRKNISQIVGKYSYLKSVFPNLSEGPANAVLKSQAKDLYKPSLDTMDTIKLIQNLRRQADAELSVATGKKIDPRNKGLGQFHYYIAKELEDLIEKNLGNKPDLLDNFRQARKTIAQTYSIQAALNPATGEVIGAKLASMYEKDPKVFTGGLRRAAEHAKAFKNDNRDISSVGGHPPLNAWDFLVAGGTAAAGHPAIAAAEISSRTGIPTLLSSKYIQRGLLPASGDISIPEFSIGGMGAGMMNQYTQEQP